MWKELHSSLIPFLETKHGISPEALMGRVVRGSAEWEPHSGILIRRLKLPVSQVAVYRQFCCLKNGESVIR